MALWRFDLRRKADGYHGRCSAGALGADRACCGAEVRRLVAWRLERAVRGARSKAAPGHAAGIGAVARASSGRRAGNRTRQAGARKTDSRRDREAGRTGRARPPATAFGLPAGPDRRDCDCSQHSRHPRPRRLRRRGSGAAGGYRTAGQASGFSKARGDPALPDGVGDHGLDPHRHGAAGGEPRQLHQRPRQFRLVRMPRPQPRGRRQTVRAWPRQRA